MIHAHRVTKDRGVKAEHVSSCAGETQVATLTLFTFSYPLGLMVSLFMLTLLVSL